MIAIVATRIVAMLHAPVVAMVVAMVVAVIAAVVVPLATVTMAIIVSEGRGDCAQCEHGGHGTGQYSIDVHA